MVYMQSQVFFFFFLLSTIAAVEKHTLMSIYTNGITRPIHTENTAKKPVERLINIKNTLSGRRVERKIPMSDDQSKRIKKKNGKKNY